VPLPDFTRTTTFRWGLVVAGMFVLYMLALFAIIYFWTGQYLNARTDAVVASRATTLARAPSAERLSAITRFLEEDPRKVQHAGVFSADGRRLAGDLDRVPPDLVIDGPVRSIVTPVRPGETEKRVVRAAARRLPAGGVLGMGRDVDATQQISEIVGKTLALGLLPAFCLSIAAGLLLSLRAQRRVAEVNRSVQRIVAGDLRQRLPTRGVDDPFDKLATIVNGMLERIEALIG